MSQRFSTAANLSRSNQQPRRKRRGGGRRTSRISYIATAKQLKSDVSKVMRYLPVMKALLNVEDKYIDSTATAVSVSTTPGQVLLNGCTQGNTASTRVGWSIKAVNLEVIVSLKIDDAETATPSMIRWVIVRDKQCNGAAFSSTSYWVSNSVVSLTNVANQQRFHTYKDDLVMLSPNGPECACHREVIPMQFHTDYNSGNAGTVADIATDSLYFMYISDNNTNTPHLDYAFRYWFVDN